jgi:DNA-binding transcriptional LysR family regulator
MLIWFIMHPMNTTRPDLNLLGVFDAILRTGSVTRAAAALNLSQPAVSHALNRLRDVTGDDLFLRRGGGLVPTARATAMAGPVAAALEAARAALTPAGFDPARATGDLALGASDYAVMALVPQVLTTLRKAAPDLRLVLRPIGPDTPAALSRGDLLASFWAGAAPGTDFDLTPLFTERLTGIAPAGHPFGATAPTLADWAACPQVVVSLGDPGTNPVAARLAALGVTRRVALVTHSFAGALSAVRRGGLIMAVPEHLAATPEAAGLARFALPLDLPGYPYGLLSHRRMRGDARLAWLTGLFGGVLAAAVPGLSPASHPGTSSGQGR